MVPAARVLRAYSARFRGLRLALGRYGEPYAPNLVALDTAALTHEPGYLVRAAATAEEQEDVAAYFMRSAAHETVASGDLSQRVRRRLPFAGRAGFPPRRFRCGSRAMGLTRSA